jgi:hypothetical protein
MATVVGIAFPPAYFALIERINKRKSSDGAPSKARQS